jgi:hypothetical protein
LFWIIIERNGDNKNDLTLNDKELVNGNIMKNIGGSTFKYWQEIKEAVLYCKEIFESRKLNECFAYSYYAFYIICGWCFISILSSYKNKGRIRETEFKFDVQISDAFDQFIDKWYFSTYLSDTWSTRDKYPSYISSLCKLHKNILKCCEPNHAIVLLTDELTVWLEDLKQSTINRIRNLRAYDRRGVITYRNILWLWNSLCKERWDEVRKPMKRHRAQPKLEVDHAIPVKIWEDKVENSYPLSSSYDATGQEVPFVVNGVSYIRSSLMPEINLLGNCSLLLRSHNRSKSCEPFGDFLKDIYDVDQIEKLKTVLLMDDVFLMPSNITIERILDGIQIRTQKIKNELIDYFNQKDKKRQDVANDTSL